MDETAKVERYLKDLLNVMVSRAEKEVDAILPGYTHLQVCASRCIHLAAFRSSSNGAILHDLTIAKCKADANSAPSRSDGPTSSSPTPNHSYPTSNASASSSRAYPSSRSVPPPSRVTRTRSTVNFSAKNSASRRSARTLCTPWRTVISSWSGCSGRVWSWCTCRGWPRI